MKTIRVLSKCFISPTISVTRLVGSQPAALPQNHHHGTHIIHKITVIIETIKHYLLGLRCDGEDFLRYWMVMPIRNQLAAADRHNG